MWVKRIALVVCFIAAAVAVALYLRSPNQQSLPSEDDSDFHKISSERLVLNQNKTGNELATSVIATSVVDQNAVIKDAAGKLLVVAKGEKFYEGKYELVQVSENRAVLRDQVDQSLLLISMHGSERSVTRVTSSLPAQDLSTPTQTPVFTDKSRP